MDDQVPQFVVTGASGQLGRAIVASLRAIPRARILGVSRNSISLESSDSFVKWSGTYDLGSTEGATRLAEVAAETFNSRFSVVNCVGYFPGYKSFLEISHAEAERVFRANFLSAYFLSLSLVPLMLKHRAGTFLAFSTLSTSQALPRMAAFDASKVALEQLMRHLANEFGGSGLSANTLALATLRTNEEMRIKPHGDHARWVAPTEVGEFVSQLLTSDCRLLNGNVIRCYHYSDSYYRTSFFDRIG